MTAVAARETILVSRFPGSITPGALPMLPELVSIHPHRLQPGRWILFRWFDGGGEHLEQSPPEFFDTLADAWFRVPTGYVPTEHPEDFAHLVYRLPAAMNERTASCPT